MARKPGLGKGLDALIPMAESEEAPSAAPGVVTVPLAAITPNPHQPRSPIDETDLNELADSIQEHGVIQPLVVTQVSDGYQLIAGERRWRASRLAGLVDVPVVVKDVTPKEMLELALVENVQRADLNALEEAQAYQQLMDTFDLTQAQVAKRVGKSRTAIANTVRLLKAAREIQEALLADAISEGHARALLGLTQGKEQKSALETVQERDLTVRQTEALVSTLRTPELAREAHQALLKGRISVGHAQALLKLNNAEQQRAALKTVLNQARSVPQTEALVERLLHPQKAASQPAPEAQARQAETKALEGEFRQALASEVTLSRNQRGAGRLTIRFESDEDLHRIYECIVGIEDSLL